MPTNKKVPTLLELLVLERIASGSNWAYRIGEDLRTPIGGLVSNVYEYLGRMVKRGWLTKQVDRGGRRTHAVYALTQSGCEAIVRGKNIASRYTEIAGRIERLGDFAHG